MSDGKENKTDKLPENVEMNDWIEQAKLARPKVDITDEDKKNFYKSFLADKRYEETIELFDGEVKLTFVSLTNDEIQDIVKYIEKLYDEKEISNMAMQESKMEICRLALSIVKINGQDCSYTKEESSGVEYVAKAADKFEHMPSQKLVTYLDAFRRFLYKSQLLTEKVFDKDFWKAVK